MDQIASDVHSNSSQHLHYAPPPNQHSEVAFFRNSSSNNGNMEMRPSNMEMRPRVPNWTSSDQLNTSSSSEMFSDAFMAPEWQQLAAQNGHLLAANRGGEMPVFSRSMSSSSFSVKNPLNLQNGWPNLTNDLETVKSRGYNGSVVTAATCLTPFSSDPGLAERAAKFSSFNQSNANGGYQKQPLSEETAANTSESVTKFARNEQQMASSEGSKKISRTASWAPSGEKSEKSTAAVEGSVVSEKLSAGDIKFSNDSAGRKRKNDRGRPQEGKAADSEESKEKRAKSVDKEKDDVKSKTEHSNSDHSVESTPKPGKENSKPSENPKQDYIHVRARRGQATDSHSLAERVRREKISERMKYLQDLVPGCNKVTGKAVMLDEIINYVQSLQRQVEFLSMKLAAVNPRLDLSIDNFLTKEMMAPCGNFSSMGGVSPDLDPYLQFHQMQQQHASLQAGVCCGLDIPTIVSSADTTSLHRAPVSADIFVDTSFQGHAPSPWDTELQNVFATGLVQGRQPPFVSQGNPGHLDANHMKMEL